MTLSPSIKFAGGFLGLLVLYFVIKNLTGDPVASQENAAPDTFTVVATMIDPVTWRDEIRVRGDTKAVRKVIARAETTGIVEQTPVEQGARVKSGDVLCKIAVDARGAQLNEARATLRKARLDYDAAIALNKEGFRSDTGVASAKAALDLAIASTERAGVELEKTQIKAPFDGVFDNRAVEAGDFVNVGGPCGTVIQQDPFLVVGAVSEKVVSRITVGDKGVATLATGEIIEGVVRFVATAGEPVTRTFAVELVIPNDQGVVRDGVSAEFKIHAKNRTAHIIPRSAIVLDVAGAVGVKTLNDNDEVVFAPIIILDDSADGVWIAGLSNTVKVIVRGQNYVNAGDIVAWTLRESETL